MTALLQEIEVDHDLLTKIKERSQNYNIAILSNGESWEQRERLSVLVLKTSFLFIFQLKRALLNLIKQPFGIFEKENFERKATLMVGDLVEHDILPAQELG